MDNEILEKARAARSPEELLKVAHENGMPDFTEENVRAYYNVLHKSGEISDEELEGAAGGCKRGGRTVVTIFNSCSHWTCDACNRNMKPGRNELEPRPYYLMEMSLLPCSKGKGETGGYVSMVYHTRTCENCYYCSYEGGMWYCNNEIHNS